MDKRTLSLTRRAALTDHEILVKSEQIVAQLLPYLKGSIAMYLAIDSEVTLETLCMYEQLRFVIPRTYPDHQMVFYEYDKNTVLEQRAYGILEPVESRQVPKEEIDVMLIPIVAFDEQRHRLGHGAGYYDRYLEGYTGLKIGIAFECQKVEAIQPHKYDIVMDMIITEDALYQ